MYVCGLFQSVNVHKLTNSTSSGVYGLTNTYVSTCVQMRVIGNEITVRIWKYVCTVMLASWLFASAHRVSHKQFI